MTKELAKQTLSSYYMQKPLQLTGASELPAVIRQHTRIV